MRGNGRVLGLWVLALSAVTPIFLEFAQGLGWRAGLSAASLEMLGFFPWALLFVLCLIFTLSKNRRRALAWKLFAGTTAVWSLLYLMTPRIT